MGVMTNIEVGDYVEVHGYDASPVWNGARLKVVEVHGGFYKGSVSGVVLNSTLMPEPYRALFHTDYLRKVEDEAPEEPSMGKPVEATVEIYLHRGGFSPMQYTAEFDSEQEFEQYQKNPFTDMSAEYKVNEHSWSSTKFLRLQHKDGTALIDPSDLQLVAIKRHTES